MSLRHKVLKMEIGFKEPEGGLATSNRDNRTCSAVGFFHSVSPPGQAAVLTELEGGAIAQEKVHCSWPGTPGSKS